MKHDTRFLSILFWETLENAPVLIGLLLAVRIQSDNLILAFIYLFTGIASGIALIHFTEVKKFSNQPTIKETLTNFAVFTILAIPFVFYLSTDTVWWSNWVTDLILGVVVGWALAVGESWGWKDMATARVHAASMVVAVVLFLFSIRLIYRIESLTVMLATSLIFNVLISMIIVRFDYWPIQEQDLSSKQ
jgi:hypothetical protein